MEKQKKALVLLSGGQDSATCLAIAKLSYDILYTISFNYGQRHRRELKASYVLSKKFEAEEHFLVPVMSLTHVSTSSLIGDAGDVSDTHSINPDLPSSFVPGRNFIFLGLAAAKAYSLGISDLITGVCQTDFSGYPDCRRNTIVAIELALHLAMDHQFKIHTPLMDLTKAQTVKLMSGLGRLPDYKFTHTCYNGVWPPCGKCPACILRQKGFRESGHIDPLTIPHLDPLEEVYDA